MEWVQVAQDEGRPITDYVSLVITDVEMPELDGYLLTRKIKEHVTLGEIPVVMHSSLSAEANQALVGADAYVPKIKPVELATTLKNLLEQE